MKESVKREVDGVMFYIRPFDAFTQLKMFGDLQREILPSVGGVLNVSLASDADGAKQDAEAIKAFRDLSANFSGDTLTRWAKMLLDEDHVSFEDANGSVKKLNRHNQGEALEDFSAVLELMYHVGKVNFFLPLVRWSGLTGLALSIKDKLSASSEPTSSKN